MSRFVDTLAQTGSVTEAVQAAGEGWQEARQAMIDTRLRQVENTGLTKPQRALFAAAVDRAVLLPGGVEKALDTEYAQTRAALLAAEGPMGEPIAELLERAAASTQDTDLATRRPVQRRHGAGRTPTQRGLPRFPPLR